MKNKQNQMKKKKKYIIPIVYAQNNIIFLADSHIYFRELLNALYYHKASLQLYMGAYIHIKYKYVLYICIAIANNILKIKRKKKNYKTIYN